MVKSAQCKMEGMKIRMDNGMEFCAGSERKLNEWNEIFEKLDLQLSPIPPRAKHLMGVIENSHRADDEYFLMNHAERCKNKVEFLDKAQRWQDTWNKARPSNGKGMKGMTPYEKFTESKIMVSGHVYEYPVVLLEEVFRKVGSLYHLFNKLTGKYVFTTTS